MQLPLILNTLLTACIIVSACKCVGSKDLTRACCRCGAGVIADSEDCPAWKIAQRLSNFANCCRELGAISDCPCPVGCVVAEKNPLRIAAGLKPLSEEEAKAIAESYLVQA
ncbi:hypothetical protein QBC37DRAFT_377774 [Rhypophila decipiens]|uniref:Uncharacterized protein n=1 Tax=Rhypophila decipiens TaxID=261697 RepID=A0AAN7B485_9PEZI|nr:hypothetical protein QBC37DRAFT_377774 [Rhypophila decipiens]